MIQKISNVLGRLGVLVCLLAAALWAEKPTAPPYEVRTPLMLQRYQLVRAAQFTFSEVRSRALADWKAIRAESTYKPHLVRLSYFADVNDLNRTASGKGVDHVTFEYWKLIYDKYAAPVLPEADLIDLNGQLIFRYRSGDELSTDLAPGSPDPLSITPKASHGGSYQLLELMVESDGTLQCYALFKPNQRVEMSELHASVLAVDLAERLQIPNVEVFLRKDSWFITQPEFPLVYRFERVVPPVPSKEAFESSKTFIVTSTEARERYRKAHEKLPK